ncbi:unnamed protein product [uncultured bacterium]|nr:unnamed protein product [uncultured bacterium]
MFHCEGAARKRAYHRSMELFTPSPPRFSPQVLTRDRNPILIHDMHRGHHAFQDALCSALPMLCASTAFDRAFRAAFGQVTAPARSA